ncbi:mechanosensitive ion channel family protein [Streptococcus chenjunshii]|uniref:Mechanosensitive ion channel family protein n=1 Tax=Streptococcus chenjunshii TaxID=2173853 RepID=A0A372KL95_9STRE|nr:mechanosensitive ion channel family protein [Streptococcus chenjunshii]AXQ79314.1 mechanosensitive ion channel family protein [Streptococcus chenjunshii]RFU50894.1 mechanosensitive ion channel family protein [Streptococcus chenjunshii]RFU53040.1 mechanosensitive ion channel family protein [Streptococcus chenjunshii]
MTIITRYIEQLHLDDIAVDMLSKAVSLLLLLLVFFIGKKVLSHILNQTIAKSLSFIRQNKARQETIVKLANNIMNYGLYFLLLYWVLTILGIPISSLLAGAGLAGLAIGLGAQGFLSDVVNGFFILLENQYDVGDSVEIGSVAGNVTSLGIRTTQVRGFDGTLYFIPNREILVVSNKSRGNMRAQIDIPIYAQTPLEKVADIIESVNKEQLQNYPEITDNPLILGLQTNQAGQLVYRINIFVQNGEQNRIYSVFYSLYQEALIANGIQLPTLNTFKAPSLSR